MNKELFGVFGDESEFERFASPSEFTRVVEGPHTTLGVQDVGLGIPDRTSVDTAEDEICVVWGEVYPTAMTANAAEWFRARYADRGEAALSELNGSYLVVVDTPSETFVATDPVRSWECYYTDDPGCRVFGSNPVRVSRTVSSPTVCRDHLLEFARFGLVIGDETLTEEVRRVPLDSRLYPDRTEPLERFVYDPQEFDYVDELARRLERAVRRRTSNPGRSGLLLSGGYDSRTVLACHPNIDRCFTIGTAENPEVDVARRVADQYDTPHQTLTVDSRYLNTTPDTVRYAHGIRESLHIHHAGYTPQMDVDTMYHGLLFDTFFRGHFLPRDRLDLFGHALPRDALEPDPDPGEALLEDSFGSLPLGEYSMPDGVSSLPDDVTSGRERLFDEFEAMEDRFGSVYNGIDLLGIQNQPTTSFRTHLADHFLESFVAVDAELLDWHLRTPPEHRNADTFLRAVRRIDGDIFRHRPHDRPHDSLRLNQIEGFVRDHAPLLTPFTKPWPDRVEQYERRNLDRELFSNYPELHDLPVRLKLRINDARCWLNDIVGADHVSPLDVVRPPVDATFRAESD